MTVTINTDHSSGAKQGQLADKQTELNASVAGSPRQKQLAEELVRGCLDCGRLTAAQIISTFPLVFTTAWLAKYAPAIAALTTNIANQPLAAAGMQNALTAAQNFAVDLAFSQGVLSANGDVIAVMS